MANQTSSTQVRFDPTILTSQDHKVTMEKVNDYLLKDDEFNSEDWFGYITEGVLLTSISAFGFIGNILSIWILLRSSLRGNFSYQLTSLAGKLHKFVCASLHSFSLDESIFKLLNIQVLYRLLDVNNELNEPISVSQIAMIY